MIARHWKWILLCLLLPLLFINVKNTHDWGDDFAQYLIQARNIAEGRPQTDNGIIMHARPYAIKAYPVGFPLLLYPIYSFSGLNIQPYLIMISVILVITGLLIAAYFRNKIALSVAVGLALLFCFNPNVLDLKKYILTEIPFTALFFLLLLIDSKSSRMKQAWIWTAIILFLISSVRIAGLAIVAGYVLNEGYKLITDKSRERRMIIAHEVGAVSLAGILFLLLNEFAFDIHPASLFTFYSGFSVGPEIFQSNVTLYHTIQGFLLPFFDSFIPSWWIFPVLAGFVLSMRKPSLAEFCFLTYSLLILFYPYGDGGNRFLLPILPLLLYYFYFFLQQGFSLMKLKTVLYLQAVTLILLAGYGNNVLWIISQQNEIEDGPYRPEAVQMLDQVRSLPEGTPVLFCKARAMNLYSGQPAVYYLKQLTTEQAFDEIQRLKLLYLVVSNPDFSPESSDPNTMAILKAYPDRYEKTWDNGAYAIYRQTEVLPN